MDRSTTAYNFSEKIVQIICLLIAGISMFAWSCTEESPEGLALTPPGNGPAVIFDLDQRPFPEIPLPNDVATRYDPVSPTKVRLNMSEDAALDLERTLRKKIDTLTGFGTYQPITVSFDAPLDIEDLYRRHVTRDDESLNLDFSDDAVYLVRIDKGPDFGKPVLLDFGQGRFPLVVEDPGQYFPYDPHDKCSNVVFETRDEDKNENSILDWGEDADMDGVLDKPNLIPGGNDQDRDLMTFYEKQTHTLIMRPATPLRPKAKYAVVLTDRLKGVNGSVVRSCFPYVNHMSQTRDLRVLKNLMPAISKNTLSLDDVVFAWTFTTQAVFDDMIAVREGLYGYGPFSFLAQEFPPDITRLLQATDQKGTNQYLLDIGKVLNIIKLAGFFGQLGDKFEGSFKYIDYAVQGSFETPNLMLDTDGIATEYYPADEDESFDLDAARAHISYKHKTINFTCTIPKAINGFKPPFPVAIYSHGYTGFRVEMLGFAGAMAKFGIASCGIDSFAHGVALPMEYLEDQKTRDMLLGLIRGQHLEPFLWSLLDGQARDLDNDGSVDSGGDFWVGDVFHTRDSVRQSVIDTLQFIRVLLACDGKKEFRPSAVDKSMLPKGTDLKLACDFNGDGVADITGPARPRALQGRPGFATRIPPNSKGQDMFLWGQSMGGIVSGVTGALEPRLTAIAPTALGGGLLDVGLRSAIGSVIRGVFHPLIGPALEVVPGGNGEDSSYSLHLLVGNYNNESRLTIATDVKAEPGGTVAVTNLKSGEVFKGFIPLDGGGIRIPFAADALDGVEKRMAAGAPDALPLKDYVYAMEDAEKQGKTFVDPGRQVIELPFDKDLEQFGDPLKIEVFSKAGALIRVVDTFEQDVYFQNCHYKKGAPLVSPGRGMGKQRNSPDFRRLIGIAQMILEPGDPVNYASHYFKDPLEFHDKDANNTLMMVTAGDPLVPMATGLGAARAAGFLPVFGRDERYGISLDSLLCNDYVYESVPRLRRYDPDRPIVFDMDDLDNDTDGYHAPSPKTPVRATIIDRNDGLEFVNPYEYYDTDGVIYDIKGALRVPYIRPHGEHGIYLPEDGAAFDVNQYSVNVLADFFLWKGTRLYENTCMQEKRCSKDARDQGTCTDRDEDACPWIPLPVESSTGTKKQ
ncbi:MAG: hypothetical protein GXP49_18020 [Deltaproteobacteria bacterium]|nr:hypothetical protein [Deltaproteobacteria bacterium]